MLTWFDNPPRRRKKSSGKRRSRKLYGAAAAAHAKAKRKRGGSKMARRRKRKLYGAAAKAHARARRRGGSHRRRSSVKRRRRAYVSHHRGPRRKWRRTSRSVARRAGRQLRYRRTNPPLSVRGVVSRLQAGAIDATWIVAGKAATRIVAGLIPYSGGQAVEIAKQAVGALAAGYAANYVSPNAGRMVLAGGLAGVIETFVKGLNIPYVSQALGDDFYTQNDPLAVGAYPSVGAFGPMPVGAYPSLMAGEDSDDILHYQ